MLDAFYPRNRRASAFTLVELLVVIGIIALLISVLLPALNKARRTANAVRCGSNMRQISLAMLQYINDNKGQFPYTEIRIVAGRPYPDGWMWATELVRLKYINAPNAFNSAGKMAYDRATSSVFYCPEALSPADVSPTVNGSSSAGSYPTDIGNNAGIVSSQGGTSAGTIDPFVRSDGDPGIRIVSWYQLNSRSVKNTSTWPPLVSIASDKAAPFVLGDTNALIAIGSNSYDSISASCWSRNISMIKRSSATAMIFEGAAENIVDTSTGLAVTTNGVANWLPRIGARHGKLTNNGTNASTNIAFFDGHVELKPTWPFEQKDPTTLTEQDGMTIYLGSQK